MIRVQLEDRAGGTVARVTVEHPKKLNILTREVMRALVHEMKSLQKNAAVRVVVITGAGEKAFIGGADLEALGSLDPKSAREFITLVHEACAVMRECPVPVIARINGYCLGAGLELAACCDLRIAGDNAVFGMPEVRLAIPSVVEAAMLPRIVGTGRARWLVMTGETIGAAEALVWGLIEKMVPSQHLDACVDDAVDALLAGDDAALRAQKRLCNLWEEAPLFEAIDVSIDEFARAYESDNPRKRISSFRNSKKKP